MISKAEEALLWLAAGKRGTVRWVAVMFYFVVLGMAPKANASLIVNEVYKSNNKNREWIEFLVTTDIALGVLDSIWFGDADSGTSQIENSNRFDSSQIISNVAYFNATTDIVRAGTIIVVGKSFVTQDFSYNPDPADPGNHDAWNLTFSGGVGITSSNPINLSRNSDVVWISSSQPASSTDTSSFLSALAYLNEIDPYAGGFIADFVTDQSITDPAFQTVHTGTGGGYDGEIRNTSLSNLSGATIDFRNSEGVGSLGLPNGGANTIYIESLRAVPEPSAFLSLAVLAVGFLLVRRSRREGGAAPCSDPAGPLS